MLSDETVERAARAAHECNRAYCAALGDSSQPSWDDAPEWQRASARAGVRIVADGATPAESHAGWMDHKRATGWTYGPVKDAVAQTHPCMVPYADLPMSQRQKDAIYGAVVKGIIAHEVEVGAARLGIVRIVGDIDPSLGLPSIEADAGRVLEEIRLGPPAWRCPVCGYGGFTYEQAAREHIEKQHIVQVAPSRWYSTVEFRFREVEGG